MKSAKNVLKAGLALVSTVALATGPAMVAHAAPWDGSNITFQNGEWDLGNFYFEDVTVIDPANSGSPTFDEYTDLWDSDTGMLTVSLDDWATSDDATATSNADIDVSDDAATGDKVLSATMDPAGMVWDGILDIRGEMRIFAAGDLVGMSYFITNKTAAPVTASFELTTDWGSSGEIFNYQNQSDAVLPVPASENSASGTALSAAGAQWSVHSNYTGTGSSSDCDAPGAVAYGLPTAANPAVVDFDGDSYTGGYDDIVIPAGATVALAAFWNWTPLLLIADNYDNSTCDETTMVPFATAATTAAAEFNSFSGRLTNGLTGYNVINWGDLSPTLPNTGIDSSVSVGLGTLGAMTLIAGLTVLVIRRRATAK